MDHDANVSPWLLVAGDRDLVVCTTPLRVQDGTLDLAALDGLISTRTDERTPTFCLNLDGWTAPALSTELGRRGIFTYHGNYYALGAMTALGLEPSGGAVRAGYLHYTTAEEADRFCEVVSTLA